MKRVVNYFVDKITNVVIAKNRKQNLENLTNQIINEIFIRSRKQNFTVFGKEPNKTS